jgi:hypothetical protein
MHCSSKGTLLYRPLCSVIAASVAQGSSAMASISNLLHASVNHRNMQAWLVWQAASIQVVEQ